MLLNLLAENMCNFFSQCISFLSVIEKQRKYIPIGRRRTNKEILNER